MNFFLELITEAVNLLNRMSVYLVFGFLFAGVVHVLVKKERIAKHLGGRNIASVFKASLFGIPLPLCSCGVLPTALSIRKDGASKPAVISFLISTPITGIDSIFATYALLGGFFTFYRVLVSFIIAFTAGIFSIFFLGEEENNKKSQQAECKLCKSDKCIPEKHVVKNKIKTIFSYGFFTLLKDSGLWIIIGIFVGALISMFIPDSFVEKYLGSQWLSMLIMLFIGIPMYVCSSGSLPIVLSLMLKGMSPGAGFVFLISGPATNSVTFSVITRELGWRAMAIIITCIVFLSLIFGYLLNILWAAFNINIFSHIASHARVMPSWLEYLSSVILVVLITFSQIKKFLKK